MPAINNHIRLELVPKPNEGSWIKDDPSLMTIFEFQVNPSSLQIESDIKVVESNFLRQDGGVVRPMQRSLKKISGSGKFFDIPQTPTTRGTQITNPRATGPITQFQSTTDAFPLVKKSPDITAFDQYKTLLSYMNKKSVWRLVHQYIGEIYVVMTSLNITNTPSSNTVDFTFSFVETLIDTQDRTGFERDTQQPQPGMAVPSRTDTETTVTYKEYKVVSGDTLSKIALKFYGNASKWTLISDYNKEVLIRGPNFLQIGWVLKIPNSSANNTESGGVTPNTKYTSSQMICPDWHPPEVIRYCKNTSANTEKQQDAQNYCTVNLSDLTGIVQQTSTFIGSTFQKIFGNNMNPIKKKTQSYPSGIPTA
jgi:LysM repeat protein